MSAPLYPAPPPKLSPELSKLVDESVDKFLAEFPSFFRAVADQNGYFERYRAEIIRVVQIAYLKGWNAASASSLVLDQHLRNRPDVD